MPASSAAARNTTWLLDRFVETTDGVLYAAAVSAEGLLLARSSAMHPTTADQLAAVVGGLLGVAQGADSCFGGDGLRQISLEYGRGWLLVSGLTSEAALGVVATKDCDLGLVSWHAGRLSDLAAEVMTPTVVVGMRNLVAV